MEMETLLRCMSKKKKEKRGISTALIIEFGTLFQNI